MTQSQGSIRVEIYDQSYNLRGSDPKTSSGLPSS